MNLLLKTLLAIFIFFALIKLGAWLYSLHVILFLLYLPVVWAISTILSEIWKAFN